LCAPRNTPAAIIEKLGREINAALADPKIKARFIELGGPPIGGLTRRFREDYRGRYREVGKGDQGLGRQGELSGVFRGSNHVSARAILVLRRRALP
jgi:hypothetical protein